MQKHATCHGAARRGWPPARRVETLARIALQRFPASRPSRRTRTERRLRLFDAPPMPGVHRAPALASRLPLSERRASALPVPVTSFARAPSCGAVTYVRTLHLVVRRAALRPANDGHAWRSTADEASKPAKSAMRRRKRRHASRAARADGEEPQAGYRHRAERGARKGRPSPSQRTRSRMVARRLAGATKNLLNEVTLASIRLGWL